MLYTTSGYACSATATDFPRISWKPTKSSLSIRFSFLLLLLLAIVCHAVAQTTGSGAPVSQNGATINPQIVDQVRYADQFSGSDIGAKVNAAFRSCNYACQVILPAGSSSYSTSISMTQPSQSLIGAGSALTVLDYTGAGDAIDWQMNPFISTQAGKISGITIHGTSAGTSGIHSGTIIGASFEDLHIDGFTGSSGACLWLDNVNGGWTERTVMARIELGSPFSTGCTTSLKMTVNGGTQSFGYNRWTDVKLNPNAGQIGVSSEGGTTPLYFYHSELSLTCNSSTATSTCVSLTGDSNWDLNVYDLVGENSTNVGTAINVASGSYFRGYGHVDFPAMALTNANGGTFTGTFRVLATPATSTQDGGEIANFLGSGVSAQVYPTDIIGMDDPEGFGIITGSNIVSPYVLVYNFGSQNAFVVGTLGYNQAPSAMTQVARIDTGGNVHAAGAYFANGQDYAESVTFSGVREQYQPGDVLVIDAQHSDRFVKAATPYSTLVAGVYSTKPGVLGSSHALGTDEFQSEIPLAINGIVPCKVTVENGPIRRGDLLVASSHPGYAMKGTDRSRMTGAIIGKALESIDRGNGVIRILLSLQ